MMVYYTQDHWVLYSVHGLIFQIEYDVSETGLCSQVKRLKGTYLAGCIGKS
jgi:hypothetical protein